MPYVPSEKTPSHMEKFNEDDRKFLEPFIHDLAKEIADKTVDIDIVTTIRQSYLNIADTLLEIQKTGDRLIVTLSEKLGQAIFDVARKYEYNGAFLGELNYSITVLIQEIPKLMVKAGKWKSELRYWLYAGYTGALIALTSNAVTSTDPYAIAIAGVFEDIKDEYKERVNKPYEITQILKSGDCYDTPYYTKPMKVVSAKGLVGYVYVSMERSDETVDQDILDGQIQVD